jgi:flagellar capping protein FliD
MIVAASSGSLAKSAITFADLPKSADSPLVRNVLNIDEGTLDSVLATDPDEVREAFTFSFASNNSNLQVFSRTNALAVSNFSLSINQFATQTTQVLVLADEEDPFVSATPGPGQIKSGSITINGQTIVLDAGYTLGEVVGTFNDVQASTGVTVALETVGAGQFRLVFTSAIVAGQSNQFNLKSSALDTNGLFSTVGITATGSYSASYTLAGVPTTVQLSATVNAGGSVSLIAPNTSALSGLNLLYSSTAAANITATATQGFGDRVYNAVEASLTRDTGSLAVALNALAASDDRLNAQIIKINEQVDRLREQLLAKFGALEQAIARVNNLLQSITATNEARNN